jgi:hypothetical protein
VIQVEVASDLKLYRGDAGDVAARHSDHHSLRVGQLDWFLKVAVLEDERLNEGGASKVKYPCQAGASKPRRPRAAIGWLRCFGDQLDDYLSAQRSVVCPVPPVGGVVERGVTGAQVDQFTATGGVNQALFWFGQILCVQAGHPSR